MSCSNLPFRVHSFGMTDIGLVREKNEDAFCEVPDYFLYLLADGMGGHRSGDVAAKETIKKFKEIFEKNFQKDSLDKFTQQQALSCMKKTIEQVNKEVFNLGYSSELLQGMGTTLCVLLIYGRYVIYAHVGDSRIYRLRNNKLEQITKDHSLLRELVDLGQLNQEQETSFMYKNILTRAVGTEPVVEPTVNASEALEGDLYLLCSDGLTDMVDKEEIEEILIREKHLKHCAKALVNAAKEKGGNDNITVVLVKIEKADLS